MAMDWELTAQASWVAESVKRAIKEASASYACVSDAVLKVTASVGPEPWQEVAILLYRRAEAVIYRLLTEAAPLLEPAFSPLRNQMTLRHLFGDAMVVFEDPVDLLVTLRDLSHYRLQPDQPSAPLGLGMLDTFAGLPPGPRATGPAMAWAGDIIELDG